MVVAAIEKDFAGVLTPIPGSAGLHVTALADVATPEQITTAARRAGDSGVGVHTLSMYAHGDAVPAGLVLGYGSIATDRIAAGMRRLRAAFDDHG